MVGERPAWELTLSILYYGVGRRNNRYALKHLNPKLTRYRFNRREHTNLCGLPCQRMKFYSNAQKGHIVRANHVSARHRREEQILHVNTTQRNK